MLRILQLALLDGEPGLVSKSLDTPAQPVPDAVPPDEGGLAQLPWLYPGRYVIRLTRGDAVLESQTIEVGDNAAVDGLVDGEEPSLMCEELPDRDRVFPVLRELRPVAATRSS